MSQKASVTEYLASIGRRGGKAISKAKAAASRANGKKGGRPRKTKRSYPTVGTVVYAARIKTQKNNGETK